jgi:hypothetical protein
MGHVSSAAICTGPFREPGAGSLSHFGNLSESFGNAGPFGVAIHFAVAGGGGRRFPYSDASSARRNSAVVPAGELGAVPPIGGTAPSLNVRSLGRELPRVFKRVDCLHVFVAPDRFDSWEAQRQSTRMARARLDGIEGDFEHDVRFDFSISAMIRDRVLPEMLG